MKNFNRGNKKVFLVISIVLSYFICLSLITGCGNNASLPAGQTTAAAAQETTAATAAQETTTVATTQAPSEEKRDSIVTITMPSCWIGSHALAPYLTKIRDEFDIQYGDRYILEIDELPGDAAMDDKIKVQTSARNLPDVFTYNSKSLVDAASQAGLLVDMKPIVLADQEWLNSLDTDVLDTLAYDGEYHIIATALRNIGYFYNSEMFETAGISAPPATWEEFFDDCEALRAEGFIPLALDNGWINNLWMASMIGTTPEGESQLQKTIDTPEFFTSPEFLDAAEMMQKIYLNYTTSDAAGNGYEQAANYFFIEQAAMIANGPWMIGDFSDTSKVADGFEAKIKASAFPSSGIIEEIDFGYVCGSSSPDKLEAATALIKLMTDNNGQLWRFDLLNASPVSKTLEIPAELSAEKPLFMALVDEARNSRYHYQTFGRSWDSLVGTAATNAFPALAMGQITPLEFGEALAAEQRKLN